MYFHSGCSVEGTRDAILRALMGSSATPTTGKMSTGAERGGGILDPKNDGQQRWLELSIVIPALQLTASELAEAESADTPPVRRSMNNRGLALPIQQRPGEGPAHAGEIWNVVDVPRWAVRKAYYVQVHNRSPLALSCQVSIDGHAGAAQNAPIPPNSVRTIQPAQHRYYQSHQWVLSSPRRKFRCRNGCCCRRRRRRRCNGRRTVPYYQQLPTVVLQTQPPLLLPASS
jgi:hypothetical protein